MVSAQSTSNFESAYVAAVAAACESPCQKSRRGAALWHPHTAALWAATNTPAMGVCTGTEACRSVCPRICLHAEQAVLLKAGRANGRGPQGAELLHIKVVPLDIKPFGFDSFKLVPSGPPSCAECSKLLLAAGVAGVWLFHEGGWRRYETVDFHRRTLEHLELTQ
ncbi:hypothetical protein Rctr197k_010 [Virus Rctr197k]|nr:hypothetical protein Rctr197k_010 [Virus Rctr197k]